MKALKVDFAPPSPWPARLAYALAAVFLAVAVRQGQFAWQDYRHLGSERRSAAALRQLANAASARASDTSAPASAPAYARDAQELARVASFDVGGVLNAIESAQVAGARVASIDIDSATRSVQLMLDAPSADVATAYVQALNGDDPRPPWRLARLQTQAGGSSSAELRATFP